jgi:hypothetical protein
MSSFNEEALRVNVNWNIELMSVQIRHAQTVNGSARSGYYKVAVIIGASVVEALVHFLLLKKIGADGVITTGKFATYDCSSLPKNFCDTASLVVCKKKEETFLLSKNPDFSVINNACLKEGIFKNTLFNKVDYVRKLRNKIHLQGLNQVDRSYTKTTVEKVAGVLATMLSMVNAD